MRSSLQGKPFLCQRSAARAAGFLLAVCGLLAISTPAWANRYGDVDITVHPQPIAEGRSARRVAGYIEYRFQAINRSPSEDHQVLLVQPSNLRHSFGGAIVRNSRTVDVAAGATVTFSIYRPDITIYDESFLVEIDGVRYQYPLDAESAVAYLGGSSSYSSYSRYGSEISSLVLTSREISQDVKDSVRDRPGNMVGFLRAELPVSEWSPNWLAYSSYTCVLMTDDEAGRLSQDVLLGLRRYVEIGGKVLIYGEGDTARQLFPANDNAPRDDAELIPVGFGSVGQFSESADWPQLLDFQSSRESEAPDDEAAAIVNESNVPVRTLLLLVILFAVGIGPVNGWLLSRRGKKMSLWWNIPVFSLLTCLLIFAYSLYSEGISGHSRTALITLLDENTHRATSIGYVSFYSPMTPSDGLHFSYDTEAIPLENRSRYRRNRYNDNRQLTLDWTKDQHLESGWVVPRVVSNFAVRINEPRRERLTIHTSESGGVTVVNGLGTDVESLHYLNDAGELFVARDVPVGKEVSLEPQTFHRPLNWYSLHKMFSYPWHASLSGLKMNPEQYLSPGTYVATVKRSPFIGEPLAGAKESGSSGVIYGLCERAADGR